MLKNYLHVMVLKVTLVVEIPTNATRSFSRIWRSRAVVVIIYSYSSLGLDHDVKHPVQTANQMKTRPGESGSSF